MYVLCVHVVICRYDSLDKKLAGVLRVITIKSLIYGTPSTKTYMFLVSSCGCLCPTN